MQQSCTRRPRQLFLSSKQGGEGGEGGEKGGGGGYQNYSAVFRSNATALYSSAKAIVSFFPVNKVEKGEEEEEEEEEVNIRTTTQSS